MAESLQQEQIEGEKEQQQQLLKQLSIEKQECIAGIKQLAKDHDKAWKPKILLLAQIMEKELKLLNQNWLIKDISSEIRRIFRENNIKIWYHVAEYLPARYKPETANNNNTQQQQQDSSTTSDPQGSQVLEQLSDLKQNITIQPRDFVSEIHNQARLIMLQCEARAELEHIALFNNNNNKTNRGENEHSQVTIDKPRPHGSLTYDELKLVIDDLTEVRKRIFEFPPEILQQDEEIAAGWKTWRSWMQPALDLKYSASWLDWFRTEKYRDVYGKHAAAVMSFSLTNLCANCSDEKTKEWVRMEPIYANTYTSYQCLQCQYQIDTVCPSCNLAMKEQPKSAICWQCSECEGTVPMTRDLTREQVGDKSSIIVDAVMDIIDHEPGRIAFCTWYNDWIKLRVGGRKIRLSDDLSNQA